MVGEWLANGSPMLVQRLANGWPMVGQWLANAWLANGGTAGTCFFLVTIFLTLAIVKSTNASAQWLANSIHSANEVSDSVLESESEASRSISSHIRDRISPITMSRIE